MTGKSQPCVSDRRLVAVRDQYLTPTTTDGEGERGCNRGTPFLSERDTGPGPAVHDTLSGPLPVQEEIYSQPRTSEKDNSGKSLPGVFSDPGSPGYLSVGHLRAVA